MEMIARIQERCIHQHSHATLLLIKISPPKSQDDGSHTTGKKTETKSESPSSESKLNVVNIVKNDNGGKFLEKNFTVSINGSANPTPQTFVGNANGTL